MKKKNRLLQRIEYIAYRAMAGAIRSMNEQRVYRWGTRFGALSGKMLRGRDALAMRNLRAAFPDRSDAELRATLDECWRHFGRQILLYVRMQSMSTEEVLARCDIVHRELLDEAVAAGHGVILISAHFGSWEVGGLVVTSIAQGVRTVARRLDNEYLERDLARIRARTGAEVIDRRHAARPLLKALEENGVVVMLPDQAVLPREGILAPFLGRPAWTTPAPAKMAVRRSSAIVFVFCIPHETRHRLEFAEPIRVDRLTEAERDPVALTTRINDVISRRIAARPDLWLWMHDRWKGTGESEVADG
ncbi:MAG TPA: lysophospholipid acyltransferase family protein [Thermoanaerobaculia bacterium]|jgi:KDO2-lipid IV(A) lauroyltransferase|nr:lysophospholipid acyltransferase family protein [Thermoanaerobaculia bacterium]